MLNLTKLEWVMEDLALPEEVCRQVVNYIDKKANVDGLLAKAYAAEDKQFDILRRKPFTRLAIVCGLLVGLKEKFEAKGIPNRVWLDSIDDIRLRQQLYSEQTGAVGLSKSDARWLRHLMRFQLFKLGSLQFQLMPMIYLDKEGIGEDFMRFSPEQKTCLPPKTPVLNTHIQFGANLAPEAIRASFDQARGFYKTYFPDADIKAFVCYSWLLYPGLKALLDVNSHILQFAECFEIISTNGDKTQAMERIFGGRKRRKADYQQTTSLQRKALANMNALGYACGLIQF